MANPICTWLVTGATGQLGGALAADPPPGVRIVAPSRAELDLADEHLNLTPLLLSERITAIINCGAYTQVDQAEDEEHLAHQINAAAPAQLAAGARECGIPIVQLSTDYVFSGDKAQPYVEHDDPGPSSAYGRSKLAGEVAVRSSGARHAILRTAWVFSSGGANFVRTMLRLGQERGAIGVVADQQGCPTHAGDLAAAVAQIALALESGRCQSGTWHVVNAGETTWYGLAERIFARAALLGYRVPRLTAISSADYPTKAVRPANSRLAMDKFRRDFGISMRGWEEAVDEAVDNILSRDGYLNA